MPDFIQPAPPYFRINLRGHWLHNAGFTMDTPYTIVVGEDSLMFQVVRENHASMSFPVSPEIDQTTDR